MLYINETDAVSKVDFVTSEKLEYLQKLANRLEGFALAMVVLMALAGAIVAASQPNVDGLLAGILGAIPGLIAGILAYSVLKFFARALLFLCERLAA